MAEEHCEHCQNRIWPQLLTIVQACEYLGISKSKGYDLLNAGQFPVSVRRIGSQSKVAKAELDEWLRNPPDSSSTRLRAV